eukprot:SAG11_NODE_13549_length_650_cov_1.063521_2_plen_73_part_01
MNNHQFRVMTPCARTSRLEKSSSCLFSASAHPVSYCIRSDHAAYHATTFAVRDRISQVRDEEVVRDQAIRAVT